MRKFKWWAAGSKGEGRYLTNMLAKGAVLTSVGGCWYHFETIKEPQQYRLIREFARQPLEEAFKESLAESGTAVILQHRLPGPGKPYYLIYSYPLLATTDTEPPSTKAAGYADISGDPAVELAYRTQQQDKRRFIQAGLSFVIACFWGLAMVPDLPERLVNALLLLPLVLLPFVWFLPLLTGLTKRRRIRQLQRQADSYPQAWLPTLTVTFSRQPKEPAIQELAYVGEWRLVTRQEKNGTGTYIYRLRSLMNEDDIKAATREILGLPDDDIRIVSSWGLYGIGMGM